MLTRYIISDGNPKVPFFGVYLTLFLKILGFHNLEKKPFENMLRKEEYDGNQHFLLFIRPSKTGRIMGSPVAGGVQFFVRSISPKLL